MFNSQAEWYADRPVSNGAGAVTAAG